MTSFTDENGRALFVTENDPGTAVVFSFTNGAEEVELTYKQIKALRKALRKLEIRVRPSTRLWPN
jgi:hypothetical protein